LFREMTLLASLQKSAEGRALLVIPTSARTGDAYGSTLGPRAQPASHAQRCSGCQRGRIVPSFWNFLPGSKSLTATLPGAPETDRLIISVDCADAKRLGAVFDQWQARARREYRSSHQQSWLREIEPDRCGLARHGPGPL